MVMAEHSMICGTCVHSPPSSFGGKPCGSCGIDSPTLSCYQEKEADMEKKKPIREWTLGEAKEWCNAQRKCAKCPLTGVCELIVNEWELPRAARFTEAEREAARAVLLLWPEADEVIRSRPMFCSVVSTGSERALGEIPASRFPSLQPGESVLLRKIEEREGEGEHEEQ